MSVVGTLQNYKNEVGNVETSDEAREALTKYD